MPHYVASDLGLHFLPNTPLGVSSIKRVKQYFEIIMVLAYFLDIKDVSTLLTFLVF